MTPKEKAQELVRKYLPYFIETYDNHGFDDWDYNNDKAKECALIAVDEILEMDLPILEEDADTFYDYWEEVKHELNKSE